MIKIRVLIGGHGDGGNRKGGIERESEKYLN